MPIINEHRVYCQTESLVKSVWLPDGAAAPTTCPTDTGHTIDGDQTAIVGSVGSEAPVNAQGAIITAPTFEDTAGVYPQWVGKLYTVTAGAINIFDELVTYEEQLRGGYYTLMDNKAVVGDYIEESVIDKDDVLGYFGAYGYTVGVDVLELKKYIKTAHISPLSAGHRQEFKVDSTFKIVAGLYLRTLYFSTGLQDLQIEVMPLAYS